MNYSTLLQRSSVDFDARTRTVLYHALPERARAAADPLADPDAVGPRRGRRLRAPHDRRPVPEHAARTRCCCTMAFGDHQVANVDDRGRGAHDRRAACARRSLDPAAHGRRPFYGDPADPELVPVDGLARYLRRRPAADGRRRHRRRARRRRRSTTCRTARASTRTGRTRASRSRARQIAAFLRPDASRFIDVCGRSPCYLDGWTGPWLRSTPSDVTPLASRSG